jgi:hypothetical protein
MLSSSSSEDEDLEPEQNNQKLKNLINSKFMEIRKMAL